MGESIENMEDNDTDEEFEYLLASNDGIPKRIGVVTCTHATAMKLSENYRVVYLG